MVRVAQKWLMLKCAVYTVYPIYVVAEKSVDSQTPTFRIAMPRRAQPVNPMR